MSGADRKRIVVLASGEGSVAQSLFDSVTKVDGALHKKLFISAVITENPSAGIVARAKASSIESTVIPFRSGAERAQWERELSAAIAAMDPWLVVSAGFMKILSPDFVNRFQIINTHPSLLPLFPGACGPRCSRSGCERKWLHAPLCRCWRRHRCNHRATKTRGGG